jgi:GDP-L-fucose synthase
MFFNLARGKEYFGRMFSFGSGAEFSRENWKPKMKESYFDQYIPSDQYGYSKYIMTKYIQSTDKIYNLRLFGVFGKYEDWRIRFISNACSHAVLDLPVRINQNVFIDYLYVDDLVDIVRRFVEQTPKYKVYNICSGKAHDLMTLAKKVVAVSGKDVEIVVKTAGLGKEYSGDNSLMMSEMEDFVPTPIDSSIKKLYGWYEKNRNMINLNIE